MAGCLRMLGAAGWLKSSNPPDGVRGEFPSREPGASIAEGEGRVGLLLLAAGNSAVGLEKIPLLLKRLAADGAAMLEFCRFRPLRGMSCWPAIPLFSTVGGLRSGLKDWDGCENWVCASGSS